MDISSIQEETESYRITHNPKFSPSRMKRLRRNDYVTIDDAVQGLSNACKKASITIICRAFEPLVQSLSRRYHIEHIPGAQEDLPQVARLGLIKACHSFDATRCTTGKEHIGKLFTEHAKWCIRGELIAHVSRLPHPICIPWEAARRVANLRRAQAKLAQELYREPTVKELAAELEVAESLVEVILAYSAGPEVLDEDRGREDTHDGEETIGDNFAGTGSTPEDTLLFKEEYWTKIMKKVRKG